MLVGSNLSKHTVDEVVAALDGLELSTAVEAGTDKKNAATGEDDFNLKSVREVIDLCGDDVDEEEVVLKGSAVPSSVVATSASSSTASAASTSTKKASVKVNPNALLMSRDVSSRAEVQKLFAEQLRSSHTETCQRIAALMKARIDAMRAALN